MLCVAMLRCQHNDHWIPQGRFSLRKSPQSKGTPLFPSLGVSTCWPDRLPAAAISLVEVIVDPWRHIRFWMWIRILWVLLRPTQSHSWIWSIHLTLSSTPCYFHLLPHFIPLPPPHKWAVNFFRFWYWISHSNPTGKNKIILDSLIIPSNLYRLLFQYYLIFCWVFTHFELYMFSILSGGQEKAWIFCNYAQAGILLHNFNTTEDEQMNLQWKWIITKYETHVPMLTHVIA